MTTYTTSLKINQIANGDQSGIWGTTTNTNWNLVEEAIAGVESITMLNANYTLSNLNGVSDEARNMVIVAGGTNSAIYQIIAPLVPKVYLVVNNTAGGFAITFGGSSGSIVSIPNGYSALVYCNGSNFYAAPTSCIGNFAATGNLAVAGDAAVSGDATVSGDTTISGDLTVTGSSTIVPLGTIVAYVSATPPTGFLLCNGAAVSRGTYADLFALVGVTYGAGDGSTTFNLPNIPVLVANVYYVIKY